jgi:suppressor for copper-sensitivity B
MPGFSSRLLREASLTAACAFAVLAAFVAGVASAEDLAGRLGLGDPAAAAVNPLADLQAEFGEPVEVTTAIEPGANGKPDLLAVTAVIEDGWHLYSLTQKPGGPLATKITIADGGRRLAGPFVADPAPTTRTVDDVPAWKGLVIEEHAGRVTWRAPLDAGAGSVDGKVFLQLCQDTTCLPPQTIAFTAGVGGADADPPTVGHRPERAHVDVKVSVRNGRSGERVVAVTLLPEEGWHVYLPQSSAETKVGQGKPTIVAAVAGHDAPSGVSVMKATPSTEGELAAAGGVDGPVSLEWRIGPDAADALVGFQTCSDRSCDPPTAVRLSVGAAATVASTVEFAAAKYAEAALAPLAVAAASADPPARPRLPAMSAAPEAVTAAGSGGKATAQLTSLPLALLMGLGGGLLLNLMPCVLPVLGLKLMAFAQQSGRDRREVFRMNLWYCAGVFAVFFALATASVAATIGLGSANLAWGEQFTSTGFNITMIAVVFAFALSFLGIWELPIPGFIGEKAGHVQTQEGPTAAFLKGVLSTVLATPCSGPLLGPVFGFTLAQPPAVTYAVFGSIATGMALPYVLVGLVPGLVRFLPKPGGWMATFKELLGFVMLGTVAFIFSFLSREWFVPTFAMLIGIWMGCWWIGRAQETTGAVGFGRWVQGAAVAALIGWSALSILGPGASVIEWQKPFSRERLAELRKTGATVMVDFSADWCLTCKWNLRNAIETGRVKAAIQRNGVVPVLADWTDGSDEIKQALESLQSRSIPVLAIFPAARPGSPPPEPIILRDLISEQQVLAALEQAGPSRVQETARSVAPAVK